MIQILIYLVYVYGTTTMPERWQAYNVMKTDLSLLVGLTDT